jgi:hypothetical protein
MLISFWAIGIGSPYRYLPPQPFSLFEKVTVVAHFMQTIYTKPVNTDIVKLPCIH